MQTQTVEDIDAVLGRFQAWTGVRSAVEAKTGIRELSDEEALRSGRYRWKGAGEEAARKKGDAEPVDRLAERVTERVKAGDGKRSAAKTVKRAAAAKSEAQKSEPVLRTTTRKMAQAAAEFREALADAVRPAEALAVAQPVELSRQIAISVRLAPAERALIRTRAAEAGISVSAYIRQCALEVEQLRAQVREAIAAMERRGAVSPRAAIRGPGYFCRIALRLFLKREPVLALRR